MLLPTFLSKSVVSLTPGHRETRPSPLPGKTSYCFQYIPLFRLAPSKATVQLATYDNIKQVGDIPFQMSDSVTV